MRANLGLHRLPRIVSNLMRCVPPAVLIVASGLAHAVAGGGGGGGSGGGDDFVGVVFQIFVSIILDLPFPYNLLCLAIIGLAVWIASKRVRSISGLNDVPSVARMVAKPAAVPEAFMRRNPGFTADSLLAKANTAFLAIQQAWTKQDLAPVRRWISDGVWQRFNVQIAMMRLLGQSNVVDHIEIRQVYIDAVEEDGDFDIVHVGIHFSAEDDFVSSKFPQLDRRGSLELIEFWTFVRKAGVAERDLYHSNRCPSCGAELPADMGEVARCPSCRTVSSLGEYDWVLSEITQADDYANQSGKLAKAGSLTQRIRAALGQDGDFSVQWIEDKASNAYLQIMAAQATRRPEGMRRFVGDELFARLSQEIAEQEPFVFNRLYLNNVTAIDFYRGEGKDNLVVAIKRTAQRVGIDGDSLRLIDQGMYARNEIMVLSRDVGAGAAKGSLYAHACPACGGPVGDTLDLKCSYCGELLNSTRREWIVTSLMATEQYQALADSQRAALATKVAVKKLDPLYAARDYALNNIMMILGCDGEISADEMAFATNMARGMGYNTDKIAGMFELAKNRRLALRLPETRKAAAMMLKLMEKAARADDHISAAEQALLDEVGERVRAMPA